MRPTRASAEQLSRLWVPIRGLRLLAQPLRAVFNVKFAVVETSTLLLERQLGLRLVIQQHHQERRG